MEDRKGRGQVACTFKCEWGEGKSEMGNIWAKDGKFYFMLCENADHIISLNTVISPFS